MHVTGFLSAIPIGALIGVLGRLVLPGRQRIGIFVTLLIGVGAALLGTYVAGLLHVNDKAPAHLVGLDWDWVELGIQVGFAVVATALAAALTHTRIAANDPPTRGSTRSRRARRSS